MTYLWLFVGASAAFLGGWITRSLLIAQVIDEYQALLESVLAELAVTKAALERAGKVKDKHLH